ncbi:MAG: aminodeoxychorismate/anthranilate synthase component II [Cyclobacteriaceae bacterium]
MPRILVIDNYDSFTFNLVHIIRELGLSPDVYRNDALTIDQAGTYDKILLSPGPGIPDEAGIMKDVVRRYGPTHSILGVCLGHQGIGEVYGARLYNLPTVLHGVTSELQVNEPADYLFQGQPARYAVCHYHSWAIDPASVPAALRVTATNADGTVMAIAHRDYDVRGVQFHPESIMTEHGIQLISNWILHNHATI